jgi:hypothetical protein
MMQSSDYRPNERRLSNLCYQLCCMCKKDSINLHGHTGDHVKNDDPDVYSSGESDCEFISHFNDLSTSEKSTRLKFLWLRAYNRARGAIHLIQKMTFNKQKIRLYGSISSIKAQETEQTKPRCILLPSDRFLVIWNLIGSVILLFIALYTPVKVSFFDDSSWAPWRCHRVSSQWNRTPVLIPLVLDRPD